VNRGDQVQGSALSEKVVWQLLQGYAATAGVPGIAPHDLRRTCAKLCRAAGGELEQIQLLLGHASVQTTERYLGRSRIWSMRRTMESSSECLCEQRPRLVKPQKPRHEPPSRE
jgi:site-specific recombinase XerD